MKKALIVLILGVGGFLAYAATRPDTYKVERSGQIEAPPALVFAQLDSPKAWAAWSPWEKMDPQMKKTFDGPEKGVGASMAWQGNDKVGQGKETITESQPPTSIKARLEFVKPFQAVATAAFTLSPLGDSGTNVTWTMDGTNNLMGKIFGIFMNMDATIGADFEKGLAGLTRVAEAEAKTQAAVAAATAKAKAEADAAASRAKAEADAAAAKAAEAAAPKGKGKKR